MTAPNGILESLAAHVRNTLLTMAEFMRRFGTATTPERLTLLDEFAESARALPPTERALFLGYSTRLRAAILAQEARAQKEVA